MESWPSLLMSALGRAGRRPTKLETAIRKSENVELWRTRAFSMDGGLLSVVDVLFSFLHDILVMSLSTAQGIQLSVDFSIVKGVVGEEEPAIFLEMRTHAFFEAGVDAVLTSNSASSSTGPPMFFSTEGSGSLRQKKLKLNLLTEGVDFLALKPLPMLDLGLLGGCLEREPVL
ncbi:hypothetical protein GQ43DRAFT_263419 [Delitschia confertaspora ATCC 74209]|uniref:Uncharacterized protein n=1 Tax=Delitschia confertaspora ATCC 74209 TaxID=1513339 RepID=A0A9P4MUB5_9PLEO|nr:hypothetical protein GQ43DRAFT_263419 [Delitschia confertaspora ATCC 74209]